MKAAGVCCEAACGVCLVVHDLPLLTIITHSTPHSLVASASIFQAAGCDPSSTHIHATFPSAAADAETMATLVRKFEDSKKLLPEQHAAAAQELVQFFAAKDFRRGSFKEATLKRDAAGKAGVVAALVQVLAIADTDKGLKTAAAAAFGWLILDHRDNQRLAADAGAMPQLLRLMSSELGDFELQQAVVTAFGRLVMNDHANQSDAAAAGAIPLLLKLMSTMQKSVSMMAIVTSFEHLVSSHYVNKSAAAAAGAIPQLLTIMKDPQLQVNAFQALKQLTGMHLPNQLELVKLSDSLKDFFSFVHNLLPCASKLPLLLDKLRKTYKSPGKSRLNGLSEFEAWCGGQGATSAGPLSDEFQTVATNATQQTHGSCYAFAAARSFNRW